MDATHFSFMSPEPPLGKCSSDTLWFDKCAKNYNFSLNGSIT